jgi:hypothetical protein
MPPGPSNSLPIPAPVKEFGKSPLVVMFHNLYDKYIAVISRKPFLKSPFFKGGFRGIIRELFIIPPAPL